MSAQYAYDDLGQLIRTTYGNGVTDSLSYDLRGWRTAQTVKNGSTDIFSSEFKYGPASEFWKPSWNGNISTWSWKQGSEPVMSTDLEYDKMSRLLCCYHSRQDSEGVIWQGYGYDKNTNIRWMDGYDIEDEPVFQNSWTYAGNRRDDCTYDANGNLTASGDGWTVTYNLLNLPASAVKNAGTDDEQTVEWSYLADGTKIFLPEYEERLRQVLGPDSDCAVIQLKSGALALAAAKPKKAENAVDIFNAGYPRGQRISKIIYVDKLPKTSTGKIRRYEITGE